MDNVDLINPIKAARDSVQATIDVLSNSLKEAETIKKNSLSEITVEMDNFLKMIYAESAAKRSLVESEFAESTQTIRNNIAENKKKLASYERAIESLTKVDSNYQASSDLSVDNVINPSHSDTRSSNLRSADDQDVPSETIYDTVIHLLYNNLSSGLSYAEISQILIARSFIPPHKNPVSVCANVFGILKSKGYIDKVNDRYMLTDSQEADYRRSLSRSVFNIISNEFDGKQATLKEVVSSLKAKTDKRRLPDDLNRRVRGILIGLKLQGYVNKDLDNGQERFSLVAKNVLKNTVEKVNCYAA